MADSDTFTHIHHRQHIQITSISPTRISFDNTTDNDCVHYSVRFITRHSSPPHCTCVSWLLIIIAKQDSQHSLKLISATLVKTRCSMVSQASWSLPRYIDTDTESFRIVTNRGTPPCRWHLTDCSIRYAGTLSTIFPYLNFFHAVHHFVKGKNTPHRILH